MDENLRNIEDLFRDGLEDNVEMPPVRTWKDIDNALNKDNIVSIKKKYSNLKRIALLLLALLLGLSIYELSLKHNDKGIANGNSSGSNSTALSKSNNNEPVSKLANKSQNSVDSNSLNKENKENAPIDNLVADKATSNNNLQTRPENDNSTGNKTTSNTISSSSKKKGNYHQNTTIDNSQVGTNMPDNKSKLNQKINPENKSKGTFTNNSLADNISVSNNKQRISDKPSTKVKVNSPNLAQDDLQTITNNDTKTTHLQSNSLGSLIPVVIDKINREMQDSVDSKIHLQSLIANKTVSPIHSKNTWISNTKKKEGKSSHFSITPFFSPDIAWYHLQQDKPDNQSDNATKIEKGEHHEFSSTTGLFFDYRLNKHFALHSGLSFSNINITINPKTIYAQLDNNGNIKYRLNISSGYGYLLPSFQNAPAVGDSLYVSATTHKLRYIGIPLAVKYRFVKDKFSIETLAGIGFNFLVKGKLETEIKQGTNIEVDVLNKIEGLKSVYLNGLAGIGATYKLSNKFSLTLMPTARIALTSINKNGVVKTYPNSVGLAVGLKIKL